MKSSAETRVDITRHQSSGLNFFIYILLVDLVFYEDVEHISGPILLNLGVFGLQITR